MKFEIKKTDRRHTGSQEWQYIAIINQELYSGRAGRIDRMANLNKVRDWCWETYGPSCELEFWLAVNSEKKEPVNEKWCWHTNYDNFKIYLRTDKEVNWFKLKWL
jgi:hypothetical protein